MRLLWWSVLFIVLFLVAKWSLFTIDASEYGYVTVLGSHVSTLDGGGDGAGLHFGIPWPVQAVQRLDRRLQQFDLPGIELLTADAEGKTVDKTLSVEAYVCWKVANKEAVDRFIRRMGTPDQAQAILGPRITSQLSAAISQMKMDDLISVSPGAERGRTRVDDKIAELRASLLGNLQTQVLDEYGIDLIDIRLRRFNYPAQTRPAIFDRIRSERGKKVAEYRSEGELKARNIDSAAEQEARETLANARFHEEQFKGKADTEAMRIRNQAHSQDPEFYAFLKKMEKLQSILSDNKTMLLLSTHRPLFDLLFQPPEARTGKE